MSLFSLWQKICEYANLSEYEAKVYTYLIEGGPSTARRLSMLCGVPRTKIYETLKKLIELELITEVPYSPKRFAPLPPNKTFKTFLRLYEEKTRDLYALISLLEENYAKTMGSTEIKREETWVLLGRSEILRKILEMMSRAEKFVDVVTTENGLILFYKAYNEFLDKLGKKGVEIRIFAPIAPKNHNIAKELRYICKVKHLDTPLSILFLRVDHDEFLLACLVPDDYEISSDKDVGMFCRSPILCTLITRLFLNFGNASLNCGKIMR